VKPNRNRCRNLCNDVEMQKAGCPASCEFYLTGGERGRDYWGHLKGGSSLSRKGKPPARNLNEEKRVFKHWRALVKVIIDKGSLVQNN